MNKEEEMKTLLMNAFYETNKSSLASEIIAIIHNHFNNPALDKDNEEALTRLYKNDYNGKLVEHNDMTLEPQIDVDLNTTKQALQDKQELEDYYNKNTDYQVKYEEAQQRIRELEENEDLCVKLKELQRYSNNQIDKLKTISEIVESDRTSLQVCIDVKEELDK
jgi:hypothetical protein